MNDEAVRNSLILVQGVIEGSAFNSWREGFVEEHLSTFTYGDEDRLEYTSIHRAYEDGVERQILNGLPSGFDMTAFQRALPAYLESPTGLKDEATGKAVTMLLETGDYVQFREMMMFTKRKREESKTADEGDMVGLVADSRQGVAAADADVAGMMDLCAALSEGAQSTDSWETVLENDWMKIDKMAVPESKRRKKSDIYLRGVWTMNLNMVEACDMMFTLNGRRKGWDPNFTSVTFPNGGSDRDDDVVTSVALNFGYLINLVMFGSGSGTQLIARNIRKWGVPTPRSVTYAMVPWNIKESRMDTEHKLLSLKTGTIAPHPTNPEKIVMTTLEINSMGGMPTWALHWMMRAVAPSMMKGLETRYIAAARNKGDVVDGTPKGWVSGGKGDKKNEGKKPESKSSHK